MDCELHRYLDFPSYYILIFTILCLPESHHTQQKKNPLYLFTACLCYYLQSMQKSARHALSVDCL